MQMLCKLLQICECDSMMETVHTDQPKKFGYTVLKNDSEVLNSASLTIMKHSLVEDIYSDVGFRINKLAVQCYMWLSVTYEILFSANRWKRILIVSIRVSSGFILSRILCRTVHSIREK